MCSLCGSASIYATSQACFEPILGADVLFTLSLAHGTVKMCAAALTLQALCFTKYKLVSTLLYTNVYLFAWGHARASTAHLLQQSCCMPPLELNSGYALPTPYAASCAVQGY